MEIYKKHIFPVQTGVLVGVLVTAILFMGLPLLTQLQRTVSKKKSGTSVMISSTKPPPPPEPERDREEMKKPEKEMLKKTTTTKLTAVPKIDVPSFNMPGMDISGGIQISGLIQDKDFNIDASLMATAFSLTEVDQKPSVLRSIPPTYPFLAKRKNIEGKVTLRFVVDKDGYAQEAEVYSEEPEGEGFGEQALKAIERYKFNPAIKDGEAVDCIVRLPITFTLR